MNEKRPIVAPAPGLVIPQSAWKAFCVFGLLLMALAGGILLMWSWWTQAELPLPLIGDRGPRWNGMSGLLMASISALMLPLLVLSYLANEKLIIAADRLQIIRRSGGSDRVDVQVPYRNIARIFIGDDEGVKFLGILLQNPADPDTFAEGWSFPATDASGGWHYMIPDTFQRGLDEIHRLILEQLRARENV